MEDKIVKTEKEISVMKIVLPDGTNVPCNALTRHTHWSSGRIDCAIEIEKPIMTQVIKEN